MYRKITLILMWILALIGSTMTGYTHPLDVSNTTLSIYDSSIIGVTYIHPVELDRILVLSGGVDPTSITLESYYSLTGVLTKYLTETLQIHDKEKACTIGNFEFQEGLMIDEIYSGGFPISYTFFCSDAIDTPIVKITFLNEVPLQTNRLYIYQSYSGVLSRTTYRVLNAQKNTHTISLSIGNTIIHDSDNDGLSDEDEILYTTDPNNIDSDNDGYTDLVEIQSSWNPISKELSPGQSVYQVENTNITTKQSITGTNRGMDLSQDTSVWGGARFRTLLRDIRLYIEGSTEGRGLWILLFSVGVLGFLHAIGPGHSKGILISQIIDDGMSYSKSIIYCLIFTSIHLLDIVVVVIITKLFFGILDPSVYLSAISRGSAILVVLIGLYLAFFSIKKYRHAIIHRENISGNKIQEKNYIIMAIITGLTPCAFGWSIFLMLLAIGKMEIAPPLLLSLGIGIFLCLSLIATITWFLKDRIYSLAPRISIISPILSSVFIVCIGLGLIIKNF